MTTSEVRRGVCLYGGRGRKENCVHSGSWCWNHVKAGLLHGVPGSWILTIRASPFPSPWLVLVTPFEVFREALAIPFVVSRWFMV